MPFFCWIIFHVYIYIYKSKNVLYEIDLIISDIIVFNQPGNISL